MKNGTQRNRGIGHAHIYTLYTYQNKKKLFQPTANTTSAIQLYSIVRDYSASPWLALRIWLCCVSHMTDTCICIMYIHIYVSTPDSPAFGMKSDQVIVSLVGFHICMYYSCSCYIQFHVVGATKNEVYLILSILSYITPEVITLFYSIIYYGISVLTK